MSEIAPPVEILEAHLSSFDPQERRAALLQLVELARQGQIGLPDPRPEVNLHIHTFFSFNCEGWSPTRVAWEARKYGLEVAGKVDFDVLEGMEEFLEAGEILRLKTVCGLETRVFIRELADRVINSPGEPGIAYFMAAGCTRRPEPGTQAAGTLAGFYRTARARNEELMARVNAYLGDVQLDYRRDVLSLTPAKNATERHLLAAYNQKAREVFPDEGDLCRFWSDKLGIPYPDTCELVRQPVRLQETIRGKLMKKGGVGYVQPDAGSFPAVETVSEFARDIGALPCLTWLDGTNPGEENAGELVELMIAKGCVCANIIPDRNWNIADPDEKALKLRKLDEFIHACRDQGLPIAVGTEMNRAGLPFVDDFSAPELRPYVQDFLDGAHFFWGHTMLARHADYGYFSHRVQEAFGAARKRRNKFFQLVGALPYPSPEKLAQLREKDLDPEHLLVWLKEG
ncbi:MAG: hypothetical protein KatS3mg024_2198 [Armatimonadota bacterium]|nr:MAG: hypothetical protein KatS3mg024_2198 [Armatimonadota bacterium]